MQTINEQFYNTFNTYLDKLNAEPTITEAIKYSFNSNGKLFRPTLMWAMLEDLGITNRYFEIALAIEMIHTYSLIHDDLPAMDNDDYRRGKLTCHKVYGEDIAILAGDGLLTHAFELIAESGLEPTQVVKLIKAFTSAAGINGMIGGQVMDVKNENDPNLSEQTLETIHDLKTAMMIELPIKCALIIANLNEDHPLRGARTLGLFYQVQDDYLDTYGDAQKMGKATQADNAKVTYTSLYEKDQLVKYMEDLANQILVDFCDYKQTQQIIKRIIQREG